MNPFDEFPKLPESLKFTPWKIEKSPIPPIPQYQAVEFDGRWFSIPRGYDWGEIEYEDENWGCSFDPQDREERETPMQYLSESGYQDVYDYPGLKDKDIFDWQIKNQVVEGTRVRFAFKITGHHTSTPDGDEYEEEVEVIILQVLQPENELDLITQLCEDARNIGFCECGNWRGDSDLAKKWNACQRCAEQNQTVTDGRAADPLYDAKVEARKKLHSRVYTDFNEKIGRCTTQAEIDAILKQNDKIHADYMARRHLDDWLFS